MGQFWVAVLWAAHRQYFVEQSLEQYWYNTWGTVLAQYWGQCWCSNGDVTVAVLGKYWGKYCGGQY